MSTCVTQDQIDSPLLPWAMQGPWTILLIMN